MARTAERKPSLSTDSSSRSRKVTFGVALERTRSERSSSPSSRRTPRASPESETRILLTFSPMQTHN